MKTLLKGANKIARNIRTNIVIGGKVSSSLGGSFKSIAVKASGLAKKVAGIATAIGTISIGKTMVEQASSMQQYRNTLNVVMKDQKKAGETFKWATQFANKTPFETDEIVQGTVKLQSYGLVAKNVMTDIGDMSSVMGKTLDEGVEAIADAQTGELERLKEFGITKQQIVDHASKIMKGKEIVNKKGQIIDQQNFNKTLFSLMKKRYKGGMEIQSRSFKGAMSTVSGVWKTSLAQIAGISSTGDVIQGSLFDRMTKSAIKAGNILQKFSNSGFATKISSTLGNGLNKISKILNKTVKPLKSFFKLLLKGKTISHSFFMSFKNIFGDDISNNISSIIAYVEFGLKGLIAFLQGNLGKAKDMFYTMFTDDSKTNTKVNRIIVCLKNITIGIKNTSKVIQKIGSTAFSNFVNIIKNISPYLKTFVASFLSAGAKIVPTIFKIITLIGNSIVKLMPTISQIIQFVIAKVFPILSRLVNFIITYILPVIVQTLNSVVPRIINIIKNLWIILKPILSVIMSYISFMMPFIQQVVLVAIRTISGVLSGLIQILDGLVGFIAGVFSGNWAAAWQGIVDIFGGIFKTIGSIVKTPLNAVIGLINGAISNINKISVDIPSWVPGIGGKHFGINIPQIPMLAKGGFTSTPSICGEAGPESVIPIKRRNPRSISLLTQTAEKLGVTSGRNNGGNTYIFAPNIHGNNTLAIKQMIEDEYDKFKEFIERYENEKGRLAYE